jgi:hypothetical protein
LKEKHLIVKAPLEKGAFMRQLTKLFIFGFTFYSALFFTQETLAAGFVNGNEIQTNIIRGSLTLQCNIPGVGFENKHVFCNAQLWSPGLTDYFVGPSATASKVTLTSTRQDGSKKTSDGQYDGATGRSTSKFNLGISTLTQKPLLKNGVNKIHFSLSEGSQVATEGDFEANVTAGPELRCPHDYMFGTSFDCDFTQNACDRYFEQNNYCQ